MNAAPDLDGFATQVLDALRDPILVIDCEPPHQLILAANSAAGGLFFLEPCGQFPDLRDLIAPPSAGDLNRLLAGMGNGVLAASRMLTWRCGTQQITRNTEFRALVRPDRRLIMLTLPDATPSDPQLAKLIKTAANVLPVIDSGGQHRYVGDGSRPARLRFERNAEWLKLSMKLNRMYAWHWERETDKLQFISPDDNADSLPTGFHGMESFLASVHPCDRARLGQFIERALIDGGEVREEFRWKLTGPEGGGAGSDYRWHAVAATAIYDAEKNVTDFVGAAQDISDRKQLEREILEIASREQQRIGNDLHDGLGQELTGIALMLRALATQIQRENPAAVAHVNEIVGLVNQSIESTHSLAHGLSPVSTNRGGLVYALRALAARSRDQYGVEVHFRSHVWPQITLDETSAGHLYRIAQEALANAIKHGRSSVIGIRLRVNAKAFVLSIEDNGIGLDHSQVQSSGMGLKIMAHRAGMIGAKLEFLPNTPSGAIVQVSGE